VLFGFAVLITESGMQAALIQRKDRLDEARSTAVVSTLVGGVLAVLVGVALAPLLGALFDSDRITELALVSSGLVLVNVLAVVPNSVLQRKFSFLRLIVVDPLEVVVFGAVSIYAAAQGLGPWALVIGNYAGLASSTITSWIFARWRPRLGQASFGMWRELVAYGRHVIVATLIWRGGEQAADTVIIGKGLGTAALGQFRYAFRIATLPYQALLAAAGYVIFPALARMQHDRVRLEAAFVRSFRWLVTLGVPAGLILVPLGPATAELVFGDIWRPAGYAAAAMCGYAVGNAVVTAVGEMLKAIGTVKPLTPMHSISTVVTIIGMLALVPFGLTAAAAGLSLGALAGAAYAVVVAKRVTALAFGDIWSELWPPLVAGSVMALAVLPLDRFVIEPAGHGTVVGLLLLTAEGLACVLLFTAVLGALAPQTVREIGGTLREKLRRAPRETTA